MPIYEYECPDCRDRFEQFKPIYASEEGETCPSCGAASKRVISKPASGFGCGCGYDEIPRVSSFG